MKKNELGVKNWELAPIKTLPSGQQIGMKSSRISELGTGNSILYVILSAAVDQPGLRGIFLCVGLIYSDMSFRIRQPTDEKSLILGIFKISRLLISASR